MHLMYLDPQNLTQCLALQCGIEWVPKHDISFGGMEEGKGLPRHRYHGHTVVGRRTKTSGAIPRLFSTFLLPAFGSYVCVWTWLWGLPRTLASRMPWVHVVCFSRIRYPAWCLCCSSEFAFCFTKYWHHASLEGIITLLEKCSKGPFFYSLGSSFTSFQLASQAMLKLSHHLPLWPPLAFV